MSDTPHPRTTQSIPRTDCIHNQHGTRRFALETAPATPPLCREPCRELCRVHRGNNEEPAGTARRVQSDATKFATRFPTRGSPGFVPSGGRRDLSPRGLNPATLVARGPPPTQTGRMPQKASGLSKESRQRATLPRLYAAVPSPLRSLTAVFGMGTGVTSSLWSPKSAPGLGQPPPKPVNNKIA
jgi:hypothetical protein